MLTSMLERVAWKREHDALILPAKSVHIYSAQGGSRKTNMMDSVQKGRPEPYPSRL